MKDSISFFVAGIPKPAGSKRGFFIKKLNRVIITDDCKTSRDWKTDVKHAAQEAFLGGELWDCPISLRLTFAQLRPNSHFGTGKNADKLKSSAPPFPTGKPDVLKLARGVEDALTQIIWRDDCLIVREFLEKIYADKPGVMIRISEVAI